MYRISKNIFIIAELSANHNNDYDLAERTVLAMADAGADAVKVQTYTADSLALNVDNDIFGKPLGGLWEGRRLWELYQEASMPYEWQPKLKELANGLGLEFFSSPFDLEGVAFLESLDVPYYKIASFEITDIPLIRAAAATGKPVIISTGVADESDIELAVKTCFDTGNKQLTLLKCTSNYPATLDDANLNTMVNMRSRFGVSVGLSDHTMGSIVPTAASALGATVIEKHFILDRSLGGPDSGFSMEPDEFSDMVQSVRAVEKCLGVVDYSVSDNDKLRRRSLYAVEDIKKGEAFTTDNIRSLRTGYGIQPKHFDTLLNRAAKKAYKRGEPLRVTEL
ncbi:pseudaminic acid synthase [Idiomarina loihiensis]|uniref:pseudaminic acid synthase n=1 Tax=Idiomarina loihiensis TaxID=135577 RepID=UPI0039BECDE4